MHIFRCLVEETSHHRSGLPVSILPVPGSEYLQRFLMDVYMIPVCSRSCWLITRTRDPWYVASTGITMGHDNSISGI